MRKTPEEREIWPFALTEHCVVGYSSEGLSYTPSDTVEVHACATLHCGQAIIENTKVNMKKGDYTKMLIL